MEKEKDEIKKTLLRLLAAVLIIAGAVLFYKGCQVTGTEIRTYHKIYKDPYSGEWRGQDVSYEADATDNFSLVFLGIPAIIGGVILAIFTLSDKKNGNENTTPTIVESRPSILSEKDVLAPLSGMISSINCKKGASVHRGDRIMVIVVTVGTTKMMNDIVSPENGTIDFINVAVGDIVTANETVLYSLSSSITQ